MGVSWAAVTITPSSGALTRRSISVERSAAARLVRSALAMSSTMSATAASSVASLATSSGGVSTITKSNSSRAAAIRARVWVRSWAGLCTGRPEGSRLTPA